MSVIDKIEEMMSALMIQVHSNVNNKRRRC